jgi:serpin B
MSGSAQLQSLVASNTAFALNLYGQLATNQGNLFFSPYSISTCLAMTYAGARGETAAQMAQVMGFGTNQPQFASLFGQLLSEIEADQQTNALELNTADALWIQEGYPFLPSFLETATNQYQANLNQVDFGTEAAAATQDINNWVAQETQNKIQNILPAGSINASTRLVLVNAIYFLGVWTEAFAVSNTLTQPFYLSTNSQVQVPLMHQFVPTIMGGSGLAFPYMESRNFQAIELPYASNQVSMVILLPSQVDGWRQLEQQLSPAFLSAVLAQMSPRYIDIFLPRFTLESSFDLSETLENMGMPDAFAPGAADFSGIDGAQDLVISDVLHKAWVAVNEAGTEAAATTVTIVTPTVGLMSPVFRADHPFLFFIRDTQSGSLLFLGRVANPSPSVANAAPALHLSLTPSGQSLNISWPYPSTGWTLRQNPDLSTTNWTPSGGITNDGTNNFLSISTQAGALFFRLSQP